MADWESGPFLIAAAPGAGKTRPALEYAAAMKKRGEIDRIAVICHITAYAPMGGGRSRQRTAAFAGCARTAHRARIQRSSRHLRARRVGRGDLRAPVHAAHAGDRRRGPPPRRRARLGPGLRAGVHVRGEVAAPFRHPPSHRTTHRSPASRLDSTSIAIPDNQYSLLRRESHDSGLPLASKILRPLQQHASGETQRAPGARRAQISTTSSLPSRENGHRYRTAILSQPLRYDLPHIPALPRTRGLRKVRETGHHDANDLSTVAAESARARAQSQSCRHRRDQT